MADENNGNRPDATVTEKESKALDGASGPNRTPAFGKKDERDENVQLTDESDLAEIKEGSAAHTPAGAAVDIIGLEAAAAAGEQDEDDNSVQYTSHPIAKLRIGRFQFERGVLKLEPKDAQEFEKLLNAGSIRTKQVVRKIDRAGGAAVARRFIEQNESKRSTGPDTSDKSPKAPTPGEQRHFA